MLLVPGWGDTARALHRLRDFLLDSGWPPTHVHCLGFRDPRGSNIEHAGEVAVAAGTLRQVTDRERIAVVAHSMGGLALRHYLLNGGAAAVHTAVFLGTPHRGTWAAWLAWGGGGAEMRPNSPFLRDLNAASLPEGVRAYCLRTPIDARVLPGSSAWLDGADCQTVRLPTHAGMLRHRATLRRVRDLLLA